MSNVVSHQKLQSQINDLKEKYDSLKQLLWHQFIWNKGSKNVNIPQKSNVNAFQHTITKHTNEQTYHCNQCAYTSPEYIENDKNKNKYCNIIGINSDQHNTKTLLCYPIRLDNTNEILNVCNKCGSKKIVLREKNENRNQKVNDYQKLIERQGYHIPLSNSCKTVPTLNENEIKKCSFIDVQYLLNQSHSCRKNYCDLVNETENSYMYTCSPVQFDANGNIETICTNSSLRKKQYVIHKNPEEQMFYRENQQQNLEIENYTRESFSNMLSNNMAIVEAGERLKSLTNCSDNVCGYSSNKNLYTEL